MSEILTAAEKPSLDLKSFRIKIKYQNGLIQLNNGAEILTRYTTVRLFIKVEIKMKMKKTLRISFNE